MNPRRLGATGWLLVVAIGLGVGFRLWHLGQKVYWFDEVYSSFRAAGYRGAAIDATIFQGEPLRAPDLLVYQRIRPESTALDTLTSLAVEDPQHPPLYFLMARGWLAALGSDPAVSRALPALISLMSLPVMYGLGLALFGQGKVALGCTAMLALSPVDVLFAQTARQYSLLTLTVLVSGWGLWRAVQRSGVGRWLGYGLAVALGLYGHVFFALNWVAQGVFVGIMALRDGTRRWSLILGWGAASALGWGLFSPWLWNLLLQRQRTLNTTSWSATLAPLLDYPKFWTLSFTSLLFDLDWGVDNPVTYLVRLPFLLLLGAAVGTVMRHGGQAQRWFVLTGAVVPFALLAGPDALLGGQRSIVTRYLLGAFPAVQVALGYALMAAPGWQRWRQPLLVTLVAASVASCTVSGLSQSWWVKGVSANNHRVADTINAAADPLVVTDRGNHFLNKGNLISLAYRLEPQVILLPFAYPASPTDLAAVLTTHEGMALAYYPSDGLRDGLAAAGYDLVDTDTPGVWTILAAPAP